LVLGFLCILNIAAFAIVNSYEVALGDALGQPIGLSEWQLWALLATTCASYFLLRRLIPSGRSRDGSLVQPARHAELAIGVVLALGTALGALGFLAFGYGKAESQSSLSIGFVFKLLPYDLAYVLMLCIAPPRARYFILGLAYASLRIAMGWTGFIASTVFILFMRWAGKSARTRRDRAVLLIAICALYFAAPIAYQLKFLARYGETRQWDYLTSLLVLLGRMSPFGNSTWVTDNATEMLGAIQQHSAIWVPFADPFLAVLPRAALGIHVENLETAMVYAIHGALNPGVIFYLSAIGKIVTLWTYHPVVAAAWILEAALLFRLAAELAIRLCGAAGRYFGIVLVFGFLLSGSLEEVGLWLYGLFVLNFLEAKLGAIIPTLRGIGRTTPVVQRDEPWSPRTGSCERAIVLRASSELCHRHE
jgi:hypothetical protein